MSNITSYVEYMDSTREVNLTHVKLIEHHLLSRVMAYSFTMAMNRRRVRVKSDGEYDPTLHRQLVVSSLESFKEPATAAESYYARRDEGIIPFTSEFRPDIQRIVQMIDKKFKVPAIELHGGIARHERTAGITRFRQHEGAAAFIMQPAAGSLGIDLSTASTMVWYSFTDSYVDFTQSEDRIALSGKANRYIYLLGGPVDEVSYAGLQEDANVSKMIAKRPEILLRD